MTQDGVLAKPGLPRVLLVHSSDELYGSDRIVLEVIDALTGSGGTEPMAKVTVWLPVDTLDGPCTLSRELRERGIDVRHLDLPVLRRNLATFKGIWRILRRMTSTAAALRRESFDLVYCATSVCLPLAPVARGAGVPRVAVHLQEPWGRKERAVLKVLAWFTTTRLAIAEHVARSTGLPARTVNVIPNGVPRTELESKPSSAVSGSRAAGAVYLVGSRWSPGKGHRTLLTAWEAAGRPGHLQILGGEPLLGLGEDVAGLVRELVSDPTTVEIIGEVPDISPWIVTADAVILPTDSVEGFGLVLIEAFRAGKPAIASRDGGPSEIIRHGEDGWLFANRDPAELASILRDLELADLQAAGRQARRRYEDEYNPETFHRRIRAALAPALPTPWVDADVEGNRR